MSPRPHATHTLLLSVILLLLELNHHAGVGKQGDFDVGRAKRGFGAIHILPNVMPGVSGFDDALRRIQAMGSGWDIEENPEAALLSLRHGD
jgi:hypothetical protein